MSQRSAKTAFLFPGQGAVPETVLTDFLGTAVAKSYTRFAGTPPPPLPHFQQSSITSDESAQLGVFHLTLAMGLEALDYCQPDIVTGYSSGLYAAMVATGCLTHQQGDQAIRRAYSGVSKAGSDSMMVGVIGLHFEKVAVILESLPAGGHLSLVNNKSQVIVSIARADFQPFKAQCHGAGALNLISLPFVYPYHVPTLRSTAEDLSDYFNGLVLPPLLIPMVVGAEPVYIQRDANQVASLVASQLHETVWWYKTIECLQNQGAQTLVVFDPTGTLTRIIRWISRQIKIIGICSMNDFSQLRDV